MKNRTAIILAVFMISILNLFIVNAQDLASIPNVINYQGYLTDQDGKPMTDTHNLIFRLYPDTSKTSNWEWSEEQSVEISNGLFNVLLGSKSPLLPEFLYGDKYLGITIEGELEMEPRLRLVSAAYSLRAGQANNAFWRSPWFSIVNITATHMTATVRYNANDEANWIFASPHAVAERNLVITGCQIIEDDRAGGDTYYVQLTKNGAEVGAELAILVTKNQELFFENFPEGLSFNKKEKIGVRLRSAAGGTEEVACILSGYCID